MNDQTKKYIEFPWPALGSVICVACLCVIMVSTTGCQILVNAVAGNLAAETLKKGAGSDQDKTGYQKIETKEQHYRQSRFWEKEGYLEYAIEEMKQFIDVAPDDPRGPERLDMLEAMLQEQKEMAVQPASALPE
jgi:hypothetical protein